MRDTPRREFAVLVRAFKSARVRDRTMRAHFAPNHTSLLSRRSATTSASAPNSMTDTRRRSDLSNSRAAAQKERFLPMYKNASYFLLLLIANSAHTKKCTVECRFRTFPSDKVTTSSAPRVPRQFARDQQVVQLNAVSHRTSLYIYSSVISRGVTRS